MILTVIEGILGFVIENLIISIICFLLSPLVWLISLPFILIIAFYRPGKYGEAVIEMLTSVNCIWRWGIGLRN
jgi:4-hydroxybenzoate polyprenyltransferase